MHSKHSEQSLGVRKFRRLVDLNIALQDVLIKICNTQPQTTELNGIFLGLAIGKSYKTHVSILMLACNGYGEDALILIRSLFELVVNTIFILKDEKGARAQRYFDYHWIIRK